MRASDHLTTAGRGVLAAGALLWVVLLLAFPAALFPVGGFICHQRPERSFFIHGQQVPVCARCTGLYAGAALAAPLALLAARLARHPATLLTRTRARRVLLLAALPTAITWSLEFTGVLPFSNISRFIAALPLGFAASWIVLSLLHDDDGRLHRDHEAHKEQKDN